jgi:mono/diheme cytochrome c family protein
LGTVIVCAAILAGGCERRGNPSATAAARQTGAAAIISGGGASASAAADEASNAGDEAPDPEYGKQTFAFTCATCHGTRGQGMPHQGAPLRDSKFIASADDNALLRFLQTGRPANDPANRSGVPMPPRGGNLSLSDARLRDVIAYLRTLQQEAATERSMEASGAEASGRD